MSKFKLRITGDLGFEVWLDIPGYEGRYQASTYGRVKSLERIRNVGKNNKQAQRILEKVLKPCKKRGYQGVLLSKNALKTAYSVHRLIALTFLPKWKPEHVQVNHKDENKTNNRVENLEWCSAKYNTNYGTALKRRSVSLGKKVAQYDLSNNLLNKYTSLTEASYATNTAKGNIYACCVNKRKTANGYIWKYA